MRTQPPLALLLNLPCAFGAFSAVIGVAGLISLTTMSTLPSAAAPATERAIVLEQQGKIAGQQKIYITPHAVRIDNIQRGTSIISSAPDWLVTTYNPSKRTYFTTAVEHYRGMMTHIFLYLGIDGQAYDFKFLRKDSLFQHPCIVYKMVPKKKGTAEDAKISNACTSFWVADDLDAPKQVVFLLNKMLSLPQSHKVPLRMDYLENYVKSRHALETTGWSRISVPKTWFDLPDGFKKANRESDVFMQDMGFDFTKIK